MKKEFKVIHVYVWRDYRIVDLMPLNEPDPSKLRGRVMPKGVSEDEVIGQRMMQGVLKAFPLSELTDRPKTRLVLTQKEYLEIGCPTVDDEVTLELASYGDKTQGE